MTHPLQAAVIVNAMPHYRAGFYQRLFAREDLRVHVYCQAKIPGMNLELVHDRFPAHVTLVPALCSWRERVSWQWLPWRRLLTSYDVLFVLGNPRLLSNVALACVGRVLGRRVVIMGQAHTAGAGALSERLRLLWWSLFRNVLVYTDSEARWMESHGFTRRRVLGLNNGLDQRRIDRSAALWPDSRLAPWRRERGVEGRTIVLSCARLEPKNRFDLWLDAMPAVVAKHPNLLWCAIGDGVERPALEDRARRLGLEGHVRWLGAIHDDEELAPWFLSSRLLVHPAAIGLTLLHAFGYGLPVVTHDDSAAQMPEFDAFAAGETGLLFRAGDAASLAETVLRGLEDEAARRRMSARALLVAREQFNVDVMADRFAAMARAVASEPR